jgi:glycerophosphoryl diester phosphodiesterase
MKPTMLVRRTATFVATALAVVAVAQQQPVQPLPHAHAHNDYEHERPLLDALDQGFCSFEADIHLVDGKLLVAHDRWQVKPERTLEALYLDPLQERVRRHGGRVYPNGPECSLLIDFKSDAASTWPVLKETLARYADMLTEFSDEGIRTNAVTVVLSGNSPRTQVAAEPNRLAGIDGRIPDLETNPPVTLVPWISQSWSSQFEWRGNGPLSAEDREKLEQIVKQAHAQGRKVRFWALPDFPGAWEVVREAGVDLINTDRLADLRRFLLER